MPTVRHDVRMVSQQFSPVCWLAAAAMVLQYKRRYTPTAQDLGMSGPDFRLPGRTVGTESPSNKTTYAWLRRLGFTLASSARVRDMHHTHRMPTMAPGRAPDVRLPEMTEAEQVVYWLLTHHGPFILFHFAGSFWYGPQRAMPRPGATHAVVITGLETTAPRSRVYFNNPWGDKDVPTTTSSIEGAWRRWERAGQPPFAYLV